MIDQPALFRDITDSSGHVKTLYCLDPDHFQPHRLPFSTPQPTPESLHSLCLSVLPLHTQFPTPCLFSLLNKIPIQPPRFHLLSVITRWTFLSPSSIQLNFKRTSRAPKTIRFGATKSGVTRPVCLLRECNRSEYMPQKNSDSNEASNLTIHLQGSRGKS